MTILCRPKGGLGNQLFIYAMAKSLAIKHDLPLLIDSRSGFWGDIYKRSYALDAFAVEERQTSLWFSIFLRVIIKFRGRLARLTGIKILDEQPGVPIALTSSKSENYFLPEGYWQEEIHFSNIKDRLKNKFQSPSPGNYLLNQLSQKIQDTPNAVCLHGRLLRANAADGAIVSVSDPKVLPPAYFLGAVNLIFKQIESPHFFVFSDDPAVFEELLHMDPSHYTLVNHEFRNQPEVDLSLMRQCKHFIISNSSYSWWGAWLGEVSDSIIIAPENNYWDNKNCVPSRWIKLNQ